MGSPPVNEMLDQLRKAFADSYVIDEEMTGGGMSRLFVATDTELQRRVVIKILPPELTSDMMIARFKRESEVTARLNHPHILPIITAGVREGLLYYIMPFIEGESLRHRLKRDTALGVNEAVGILREVSSALAYAHKQGVIHRDIKPENILLQEGHAVLADFGIAAALAAPGQDAGAEKITRTGMSLGTVGYMAPEQATGDAKIDGRADIYALGVVGYEMLAGSPPFTGETTQAVMAAHFTKEPERLEYVREDVPDEVGRAIRTAMAKNPNERFQNADEFRNALELPAGTAINLTRAFRLRKLRKVPLWKSVGLPAAVGLLAYVGWTAIMNRSSPRADSITVAIAPFSILGSGLSLWREGVVDLLSHNLDGAGPIRTVSPTVSSRFFPDAAVMVDRNRARDLGRKTSAKFAVFGRIVGSANDSVAIHASLLEVVSDRIVNIDVRDATVEAATDRLTRTLLDQISTTHRLGAVRATSLGSRSVPALRAFLQGEQFFRRTSWDSASASYDRAVTLDPTFAVALRRGAQVLGWTRNGQDSAARALWIRAGNNNKGLSSRDSLLISADSLSAALGSMVMDSLDWSKARRLFATLNEAVARYPDDPEVWFQVGEARFHHGYGRALNATEREVLDAFDRSIQLDSAFAPAYVHAIELAYNLDGGTAGQRYARKYLSLRPTAEEAEGIELLTRLADGNGRSSATFDSILDRASSRALMNAYYTVRRWPDSAETALRILNAMNRRPHSSPTFAADSAWTMNFLVFELAYRGHMREALLLPGSQPERVLAELAIFGMIPRDSAAAVFERWIQSGRPQMYRPLPWFANQRDTNSIARLITAADTGQRTATGLRKRSAIYRSAQTRAYMSLARGDSGDALMKFLALPDSLCIACYFDRLTTARLLAAKGRHAEAEVLLRERLYTVITPSEIWIAAERARVLDKLRRPRDAARNARLVVDAWKGGDPEVRPVVSEAVALLKRAGVQ